MRVSTNIFMVLCLVLVWGSGCETKSEMSSEDGAQNAEATETEDTENQDDSNVIDTDGRDEDKKTFIDYCNDDTNDVEIQKTVNALKELAGDELCGVVQGEISRTDPLDLSRFGITDLRPLRGFNGIRTLILRANSITDISHLTAMTGLRNVDISRNPLKDVSALAGLQRLETLDVSDTDLESLDSLSELTSLTSLLATDLFQVETLEPIANLTSLETLDVSASEIVNLNGVGNLTSLTTLRINSSLVTDVSAAAGLSSLVDVPGENPDRKGFEANEIPIEANEASCPTTAASSAIRVFCEGVVVAP